MSEKSNFEKLAAIDVKPYIEKKGGLSYLSWAWAVDQLLRVDPKANWAYLQPTSFSDGTMLVACAVTAFDKTMSIHLPVMDYKNKAIPNPDAFQVNTAMMRCLVKCIALHGLGLYIYAGEDLPLEHLEPVIKQQLPKLTDAEAKKAHDDWIEQKLSLVGQDPAVINEAWFKLPSNYRTAIKAWGEKLVGADKLTSELDSSASQHLSAMKASLKAVEANKPLGERE